jgi:predicted transcriptional regulator
MEVTLRLPKNLYKDVSEIAQARKKSVAEIIKNAVRKEVANEATRVKEQTEIIKKSVEFCSDKEVMALASLKTSEFFVAEKQREQINSERAQRA